MQGEPVAQARLRILAERNAATGDIEGWLTAVDRLHGIAERQGASAERLRELRAEVRCRADELRSTHRSRLGRLWAAQLLDQTLGRLIAHDLDDPATSIAEAFAAAETLKARTLLDQQRQQQPAALDVQKDDEALRLERSVLSFPPHAAEDIAAEELRYASRLPLVPSGDDAAGRMQDLRRLEELYAGAGGGVPDVLVPPGLDEVQRALAPDELLVEFVFPYEYDYQAPRMWVLTVARDDARLTPLRAAELLPMGVAGFIRADEGQLVEGNALARQVYELRVAIREGRDEDAEPCLRTLHELLVEPVASTGLLEGRGHLIVVPQGVLHTVPWAALTDDVGFRLIERVAISTAPSAATWLTCAQQRGPRPHSFLGVGNPDAGADWPSLPDAELEVQRVAGLLAGFETQLLCRDRATESAVLAALPGKGIVHFATHGEFPEHNPMDFHRVILAPDDRADGRLDAEDLRRVDLLSAWLVVLSICDGAIYRVGPGDEPYGLVASLLPAGTPTVIGTLWPLDDRQARAFMQDLYRHVPQEGAAEATRRSMLRHLDEWPLQDWAGFVTIGSGRRRD